MGVGGGVRGLGVFVVWYEGGNLEMVVLRDRQQVARQRHQDCQHGASMPQGSIHTHTPDIHTPHIHTPHTHLMYPLLLHSTHHHFTKTQPPMTKCHMHCIQYIRVSQQLHKTMYCCWVQLGGGVGGGLWVGGSGERAVVVLVALICWCMAACNT